MFSVIRPANVLCSFTRAFTTTPMRGRDMAKLSLIGRLAKDAEARLTKNEKEYIVYTVVTRGFPSAPDANGERQFPPTFHRVLSFSESANKYLRSLRKGSQVYAEAAFELREPEPDADPTSPQGQRQIFLRHETLRVLSQPKTDNTNTASEAETYENPQTNF